MFELTFISLKRLLLTVNRFMLTPPFPIPPPRPPDLSMYVSQTLSSSSFVPHHSFLLSIMFRAIHWWFWDHKLLATDTMSKLDQRLNLSVTR